MEEEIRALLLADSGVSSHIDVRVNWGAHPQGQPLPAIVLNVVSDAEGLTMSGPNNLSEGRVQVDCYAHTYEQAKKVSRSARALLHGYRGGGFRLVEHVSTRDSREGGRDEAERPYRVSLDFTTAWRLS